MASFITVDRKILKWEWYQDVKVFHLFLYFLLRANWEDGRWKGIEVKRGQLITGRLKLSKDTGLSEMEIRTCLNKLKTTSEITIKATSKYSIITVCKYDVYQSKFDNTNQYTNQQHTEPATNNQPTINQQSTTNNTLNNKEEVKEENKFKLYKPLAEEFNGLPDVNSGQVIQLLKITKQTDVSKDDVEGLWSIFKIQNLTGKKPYKDKNDVFSHFLNWSKTQKFEKNGYSKGHGGIKSTGSGLSGTAIIKPDRKANTAL